MDKEIALLADILKGCLVQGAQERNRFHLSISLENAYEALDLLCQMMNDLW